MSGIIQYVVVRGDLSKAMGWPLGAVVAQACHACTAVTHLFYNDAHTQAYLADLDNMHKVVLEVSMTRFGELRAHRVLAFNTLAAWLYLGSSSHRLLLVFHSFYTTV